MAISQTSIVFCGIFVLATFSEPVAAEKPVPASERVKACDSKIALAAAEEIVKSQDSLREPLQLHYAAAVLFDQGRKDEAVFWSWVAQLQDWYRFPGPNVDQLLTNMRRPTSGPIDNYALQDTRRFEQILARVQKRDRDMLNAMPEKQEQVYSRLDDLRARIAAQREEIEKQARAIATEIEQKHASMRAQACLKVLIHPADAPRLIAAEQVLVVEFVKHQPDVISAVGVVQGASLSHYTVPQDHRLPSQYEVTVTGNKVIFAIVDVSRDASKAHFKLACVARTSFWHRDPFADPCKQ